MRMQGVTSLYFLRALLLSSSSVFMKKEDIVYGLKSAVRLLAEANDTGMQLSVTFLGALRALEMKFWSFAHSHQYP